MTVTNKYLIGRIGVRVVMIGGCDQAEFTLSEQHFVVDQVRIVLDLLTELEPRARLDFDFASRYVETDASSSMLDKATDAMESAWREAAFATLGFSDYGEFLRQEFSEQNIEQGFLVLVSGLPTPHFAYSTRDKITLDRNCGGYLPNLMHALLLHEICHVFGAADETGACHCNEKHGFLGVAHGNCYACRTDPEPCIMAANSLRLCASTRSQIGWDEVLFPS